MAQPQLTQNELAAISAQFANPVAVDDARSEMIGQMPPNAVPRMPIPPPRPMPNHPIHGGAMMPTDGFIPDQNVEDHATVPQDGVGVPSARPFNPNEVPMPPPGSGPYGAMNGGAYPRDEISVYEDNGQKFMIKNGCIFKQTWTTIENGSECRMFDVRKGKKVQPKGIVIQKYDWVPLSVANAMSPSAPSKRTQKPPMQTSMPEQPSEISVPVQEPPKVELPIPEPPKVEQPAAPTPVPVQEKKEEPAKQKKPGSAVEKVFKPLAKPVAKPAATKDESKKPAATKNAVRKVNNAGILTTKK